MVFPESWSSSTFNWYGLVDGLQEEGYRMHLANASAIRQYEGIRHTDEKWDAFWLAQLLLLGIQPEGCIYPKAERSARERKRPLTFFFFKDIPDFLILTSRPFRTRLVAKCHRPANFDLYFKAALHRTYCFKES
jgi:hypothetical protein